MFDCMRTLAFFCLSLPWALAVGAQTIKPLGLPGQVTVSIKTSTGATSFCQGSTVTFEVSSSLNGGTSPTITWFVNGSAVGSGSTYSSSTLSNGASVHCVMASSTSGVSPGTSNTLTISFSARAAPSVSISASTNNVCQGTSVTFTPSPVNGGTAPTYQWLVGGSAAATGSTYTTTGLNNGQVVSCIMTSNSACITTSTATSNGITMSIIPPEPMTVSVSGPSTLCNTVTGTYQAEVLDPPSPISYQWTQNGSNVGTNSFQYNATGLSTGSTISCTATTTEACYQASGTSNTVTVTVTSQVTPAVGIIALDEPDYCVGDQVTFHAGATPDIDVTYQWFIGGTLEQSGTNDNFIVTASTAGQLQNVSVTATPNTTCLTVPTASASASGIPFVVEAPFTPTVSVSQSVDNPVCAGTAVTFSAEESGGGTNPAYAWTVNGTGVGAGSSYSSSSLANGTQVSVAMTSTDQCARPASVTSSPVTLSVTQPQPLDLHIVGNNPVCSGTPGGYTVDVLDQPGTFTYAWFQNGVPEGSGTNNGSNDNFTPASLNNGDVLSCQVSTNIDCIISPTTVSQTITVNPRQDFVLEIYATPYFFCPGMQVVFTAQANQPLTAAGYAWTFNGSPVTVTDSSTFTVTAQSVNQLTSVTVSANTTNTCVFQQSETFSGQMMPFTQMDYVVPLVAVSSGVTGSEVTFTATPTFGGASPLYQWQVNGVVVPGLSGNTFTTGSLTHGQVSQVVCTLTASLDTCPSPASVCVSLPFFLN